jgi:hypothetical protein
MSVYVIICGVGKKVLYFVGQTLATLVIVVRSFLPLVTFAGARGTLNGSLALGFVVLSLATMVAVVAHELGHLVACRAVGAEVKAFQLGGKRAVRFRAGTVEVSLGLPYSGRVTYTDVLSVWRRVVITLAGPLVDLALGGLLLGGWVAAGSGPGIPPLVVIAAGGFTVVGLTNLMPFRARSGRLTDGARLFEHRSGVDAARLAVAAQTASRLRKAGRARELLELHAGLSVPARRLSPAQAACLAQVELNVVILPELSDDATLLAERRLSALTRQQDLGPAVPVACVALARLRQGRFAEVEEWCGPALAVDVGPDNRATVLATVVLARRALGQPHADLLAEAVALAPDADLVAEARSGQGSVALVGSATKGGPDGF